MATNKATSTKKKAPAAKKTTSKSAAVSKTTVKTVPATAKKQTLGQHIESSLQSAALWRSLGAEFIGTFLLVAVIVISQGSQLAVLFALIGIVLLVGALSGAHLNPAITIGAWVTRRIGWLRAIGYIFVQFLAAAVALVTLQAFLNGQPQVSEAAAAYGQGAQELFKAVSVSSFAGKEWYVFFAEILGTTILGFAIANALRMNNRIGAAMSAGFGIFVALMVAGAAAGYVVANTIINPAVALGLQVYSADAWAYIVYALGPVIGAAAGFVIYDLLYGREAKQ
jgi:aquaporin Z